MNVFNLISKYYIYFMIQVICILPILFFSVANASEAKTIIKNSALQRIQEILELPEQNMGTRYLMMLYSQLWQD